MTADSTQPDLPWLLVAISVTWRVPARQIVPPRAGTLEIHTTAGVTSSPVDKIGCFVVDPIPDQPVPNMLPRGGRDRRADRVDHVVTWAVSLNSAQPEPRQMNDQPVAMATGSDSDP